MITSVFTKENVIKSLFIPIGILSYEVYTIHGLLAIFISIQIHELGHYIALNQSNLTVLSTDFGLTQLDFEVEEETLTLKNELLVSGSGPLAGVLSTILITPYLLIFLESELVYLVIVVIVGIHLINLIPLKGYDGYYIKEALQHTL